MLDRRNDNLKKFMRELLIIIILISTLAAVPTKGVSADCLSAVPQAQSAVFAYTLNLMNIAGAAIKTPDMVYPHYLRENYKRYHEYHDKNPGMPFSRVIAYVNAGVDLVPYADITIVSDPESIAVMMNKNFSLPLGYEPEDMVDIGGGHLMREEAAEHFLRMKEDITTLGYRLHIVITYRPYQQQARRFNDAQARSGTAAAERQFARPGHSDHQTGLALDFLDRAWSDHMSYAKFENTGVYAWLCENAYKYGFILRYPRNYGQIHGFIYEPWHWRYVGEEIATAMYEQGIDVFEEYYGKYLAPGVVERWEKEHTVDNWRSWMQ